MVCQKCGRELPDEAEFCYKCGSPVKKEPVTSEETRFLKLSWTWQPLIMAATDDEELGSAIYELWKQKARLPQLVETKTKDGVMHVWYAAERLRDVLRMGKKQDVLNIYDATKGYVLDRGWQLSKPEVTEMAGRNDYVSLDSFFIKS
jgi:predicted amidophosphoribosyltransferase